VSDPDRPARTWSNPAEILPVCLELRNLSRCIAAALIVGTILFLINQGDVVFGGQATASTWIKIGLSYLVPFFVANYGIVLGSRRSESR
jgi:hypothetical protein